MNGIWLVAIFPPARLFEFVAGIVVALEVRDGRWPRLPLPLVLLLAVGAYLIPAHSNPLTPFDGDPAVTFIPFILVIARFAQADLDGIGSWFARRQMVKLGEWSYAFYLVHWLIVFSAEHALRHRTFTTLEAFVVTAALFMTSLFAAAALYTFFERPIERHLRGGSSRAPTLAASGSTTTGDGALTRSRG